MQRTHRFRNVAAIALVLISVLMRSERVFALDPSLDVSQYAHTAWRIRDGFSKGRITSITQTADGYLWLGTEFGLLRFDGVRAVAWEPPGDQPLPSSSIWSVLAARDGTLWIGTEKGLASWKRGKLTQYPQLSGRIVMKLLEDHEGTIWVSGTAVPAGILCAIRQGEVSCSAADGALGYGVFALYEDQRGNIWAGVMNGFWRWRPGQPTFFPLPNLQGSVSAFVEEADGALLVASRGMFRLADSRVGPYPLSLADPGAIGALVRDRDGALWMATSRAGLLHQHQGRNDGFARVDGLSHDVVIALFEDREGSIWVATESGLDRFRTFAVPTLSEKQGIRNVSSVVTAGERTLIATAEGLAIWNRDALSVRRDLAGLTMFHDNQERTWLSSLQTFGYVENDRFVHIPSVAARHVRAIVQDTHGSLWIADQELGLFQVSPRGDVKQTAWRALGRTDFALTLVADRVKGGLWIGFWDGGIIHFMDGVIRATYTAGDGLGSGHVNGFFADRDALWVATEGGLSRLRDGRATTLSTRNQLPCNTIHWVAEDNVHDFWLGTSCGLVRVERSEIDAWLSDGTHTLKTQLFDNSDGVRSSGLASGYNPHVAKAADGRIWFTTLDGVSIIDPRHLNSNTVPPPVQIEQITADHKIYPGGSDVAAPVRLPALIRDLQVDYTALSLVAPEKMRFRYKLEGYDREWHDAGTRRQAFYNDLPPRTYRFRVTASNNSGVWNETGAALEFSVAPAYYQTAGFAVSVAAAFLLALAGLYQLRLRQVSRQFNLRMDERVNERMRIARDLHDTLLQSFHGLLFRFQAATNLLPERPADAKREFESAIDQAAQAITEGRDAVQNLRGSAIDTQDLAVAIRTLGEELAAAAGNQSRTRPIMEVAVEGTPRDLHPILRDDIYRIAGEAMRNAFRHAHASRIEVEIWYDDKQFQLRVRDDGKGIDPNLLRTPEEGHFGLSGMRERAELVGGHLDVWSEVRLGTEVDVKIPAAAAYATPRTRSRLRSLFAAKTRVGS